MKKLLLVTLLMFIICNAAFGAQIFTTTIQDTTVQEVTEVSLEYMMEKNFAIDRVEEYTITFTKGFGDGFWIEQRNMIIKFNLLQKNGNVKLMVTQFEDSPQALIKGQRSIEHLVPLIQDIRHSIDGTPLEQIVNEVTNQQPSAKPVKSSGLYFDGLKVKSIEPDSIAENAGLEPNDTVLEINGRPADEKTLKNIDKRLAAGHSVVITYERGNNKNVVTLK